MSPIRFPECNSTIAEKQPPYSPLPALRFSDVNGTTVVCWKLTWKERLRVLFSGRVWHTILTFNNPLQPIFLSTDADEHFEVHPPHPGMTPPL